MAQEKKGLFQRWGESLKKKRSWILYGTAVATLFLTAACWTLLPERVVMQAAVVGQAANAVAKETAILANLGPDRLFAALFAWRAKGGRLLCGTGAWRPAAALPAAGQPDGVIMELEKLKRSLLERTPGLMDATGQYSVLVPLVEGEGGLSLLYEVRAGSLRRQPGEVCFPGGRLEGAESPEECALRETWEELGIPREKDPPAGVAGFYCPPGQFYPPSRACPGGGGRVGSPAPQPG